MALQVCAKCETRYAPAAQCPHCGHDQWRPDYEVDAEEAKAAAKAKPAKAEKAEKAAPDK
jgi:ribosomal protein L40E